MLQPKQAVRILGVVDEPVNVSVSAFGSGLPNGAEVLKIIFSVLLNGRTPLIADLIADDIRKQLPPEDLPYLRDIPKISDVVTLNVEWNVAEKRPPEVVLLNRLATPARYPAIPEFPR
jgi:hypothetical protein